MDFDAQITSVAAARADRVVAFSREPAALFLIDVDRKTVVARVALSTTSREDTGHAIFHSNAGSGTACASCHAEGRDDGHAWLSRELGARRTASLVGTVANTAPYLWNGEAADMRAVAALTFTSRMRGPNLTSDQADGLGAWVTALRPLMVSPPKDAGAIARGKAIFESSAAKCSSCHAGVAHTNNATLDVGTGGSVQVPSLVNVGFRAPYFHDGSRATLDQVIGAHGNASVTASEKKDLAALLRTF
jgi:cytochrome c peroxidase